MAFRYYNLPFSMPNITAQRRIACGFSAFLVAVASLAVLGVVIAAISGIVWFVPAVGYGGVALFSTFVGLAIYRLITSMLMLHRHARNRREERNRRGDEWQSPVDALVHVAVVGAKFVAVAAALLCLEGLLLSFWASHPALVLRNFWAKGVDPAEYDVSFVLALAVQLFTTAVAWLIWCLLDRRKVPSGSTRFLMMFFLMMIPLWGMHVSSLISIVLPTQGALIGWALTAPIVGIILGAAYSCEENIFDKLHLRR